jgi:hypothetical protein
MCKLEILWARYARWNLISVFAVVALAVPGWAAHHEEHVPKPVLLGEGKERFTIGSLLYEDNFSSLKRWSVQIEDQPDDPELLPPRVRAHDNTLDARVPGAGATIWFKPKLEGPVTIMYQVRCPETPGMKGAVPRDINNFWHMSARPDALLQEDAYSGSFGTYHELEGYYASTGGRDNTTTRFRRYPRRDGGETTNHIALQQRDGKDPYLIEPGKTHTVQLVAYQGLAQYIVDGRLVYEIEYGSPVRLYNGETVTYTPDKFPAYHEGWFGFRMVRSYHVYSNFRVYRLKPSNPQTIND